VPGHIRIWTGLDRSENPGRDVRQRRSHWVFRAQTTGLSLPVVGRLLPAGRMRSAMTTADWFGTRVTGSIPVSPTYERRLDPLPVEEARFRAIHVQCGCRTHPASTHSSRSTTTAPEQYCDPHDEVGSICAAPGHRHAYGQHRRSWPRYCRHRTSGEGRPCRLRVLAHPGRVEGTQARHRLSSFVARRSRRTRASRRGRAATRRAAFVPAFVPHALCRPGVASPAPGSPLRASWGACQHSRVTYLVFPYRG
jgi:hypothetical protein